MQIQPRTDKAAFRAKVLRGEPVTAQDVFDVAVEGVILQGAPSIYPVGDRTGQCSYRTPEGLECAAGQVWPDELYDKTVEGRSVLGLADDDVLPKPLRVHLQLLEAIQQAHDNASVACLWARKGFPESFAKRALRLANFYDLTVPPLLEALRGASADAR
jgi:hypothetical protein